MIPARLVSSRLTSTLHYINAILFHRTYTVGKVRQLTGTPRLDKLAHIVNDVGQIAAVRFHRRWPDAAVEIDGSQAAVEAVFGVDRGG